jgi:phenylpropionate dioxygenase-like ring-hydroxylating dioxygenase large terminal subunit
MPRFPNGFVALDPSGFNWMTFWPVGHNKVAIVSTILGETRDDPEAEKAYWAQFSEYQKVILAEDLGLFPTVQRSMDQGDLTSLVLSCQEQYLQWYHEHIDRLIGPENIPAHLRVEPVMAARFKT